jgi:hypothetical protein
MATEHGGVRFKLIWKSGKTLQQLWMAVNQNRSR